MLRRDRILPEDHLPAVDGLITAGRDLAGRVRVAPCPFLTEYGVDCEATYKRARMGQRPVIERAAFTACLATTDVHEYGKVVVENLLANLGVALVEVGMTVPIFIGGKLNQVPDASNTSLPVDISAELRRAGALPCHQVSDMFSRLAALARETSGAGAV